VAGLTASRPQDEIGAAVAVARNGSHFLEAQRVFGTPNKGAETTFELPYLAQIADWIALQPDAQYVVHPDTSPTTNNAPVLQLELEMMF
jgi:porin